MEKRRKERTKNNDGKNNRKNKWYGKRDKEKKSGKESKLERKVKKMGTRKCFPLRKGKGRMKNNEKEI